MENWIWGVFVDSEIGVGIDGNPEGYDLDLLPNSQTSNKEVSEQDPVAN